MREQSTYTISSMKTKTSDKLDTKSTESPINKTLWRDRWGLRVATYAAKLDEWVEELEKEVEEQARLNGMGSEREARLMAKVTELEREIARLRADQLRIDWLEQSPDKRLNAVHDLWCNYGDISNVRAAIDAARKEVGK